MALVEDVMSALGHFCEGIVYPSGIGSPSVAGVSISLTSGWPGSQDLDNDLANGTCRISVFSRDVEKPLTILNPEWVNPNPVTTGITLTVSGDEVMIGGTIQANDQAFIGVDGTLNAYVVQSTDTINTVATALAGKLTANGVVNSVSGSVITIPGQYGIIVSKGAYGNLIRAAWGVVREFQVSVWSPSPALRTLICRSLEPALVTKNRFVLPDGSIATAIYRRGIYSDDLQKRALYIRHYILDINFSITETLTAAEIIAVSATTTLSSGV